MDGLELGTVVATEDTFFLEDRGHVYLADSEETKTFSIATEEHTGEVTEFNEKDGLFYSVYNSGFTEDGGYASNIRFGNEEGFETVQIPHYLQMSGIADGHLLMVTGDNEGDISLQKMPFQKEVQIGRNRLARTARRTNRNGVNLERRRLLLSRDGRYRKVDERCVSYP